MECGVDPAFLHRFAGVDRAALQRIGLAGVVAAWFAFVEIAIKRASFAPRMEKYASGWTRK